MSQIPSRDLRNHVSAILRRVENGESLTVTVNGRPVARLEPLAGRPQTMPSAVFRNALSKVRADPALASELAALLAETTDDLP